MAFTKRAHLAAQRQFYPPMNDYRSIKFQDTVGSDLDMKHCIDFRLGLKRPGLKAPMVISVQERWRRPEFRRFRDVTITAWNLATNLPAELHKLDAHIFVYGFYDEATDRIVEATAIRTVDMVAGIHSGRLEYQEGTRGDLNQSFVSIKVDALKRIGAIIYRQEDRQ